jgi:hypothetical protein
MVAVSRSASISCTLITILAGLVGNSAASRAQQQHPHHDIYADLFENGGYRNEGAKGLPCCGDDPINGDCEPVGSAFSILPDGDFLFTSQRHHAQIQVARDKVLWMTLRGGEFSEAHWCGRLRRELVQSEGVHPPTTLNPDPVFWTFCAMISPRDM